MVQLFKSLWDDESGQAVVEYGLVVGLVAIAAVAVFVIFQPQLEALFQRIGASLEAAVPGGGS